MHCVNRRGIGDAGQIRGIVMGFIRKPSMKRSLSAMTKAQANRALKRAFIPGYGKKGTGMLHNPKKAVYNKIYNKTTIGYNEIFNPPRNTQPQQTSGGGGCCSLIFFLILFLILVVGC